jgi:hypothetical protein
MECFFLFLMLLIAGALLAGFGSWRTAGHSRRWACYRELAERFHGTLTETGWRGWPRVVFSYRAVPVTVEALARGPRDGGRGPAVRVRVPWRQGDWQVEICHPPRATPPRGARSGAWQPLQLAGDAVPWRCSAWRTDAAAAGRLLNDVVRWNLERLRSQPAVSPLSVRFGHGELEVYKRLEVRNGAELISLVETLLDLHDQALLTQTQDITFLEQDAAQVLEQPVCRVCGEAIREELVFCRRCKTPHHRDCWLYVGRCSVFGCGESQFREPQVARRLPGETGTRASSD